MRRILSLLFILGAVIGLLLAGTLVDGTGHSDKASSDPILNITDTLVLPQNSTVINDSDPSFRIDVSEDKNETTSSNATLENSTISTKKHVYTRNETVEISILAPANTSIRLIIKSPDGLFYEGIPSSTTDGFLYAFKPTVNGNYLVNANLSLKDELKNLSISFDFIDLEVRSDRVQGTVVIGEPVNWTEHFFIRNPSNLSFNYSIPLPADAFNITSNSPISNSTIILNIKPEEVLSIEVRYQTPPVQIVLKEDTLDLENLIPSDAFGVELYREIGEDVEDDIKVKKIEVRHNSSVHYEDIPISIKVTDNGTVLEVNNGTERVVNAEIENNTAKWIIPELSNKTYIISDIKKTQDKAVIGEPVSWTLRASGTIIKYKTPAPFTSEAIVEDGGWKKRVIVQSNASVHYHNVTAYTDINESKEEQIRLFWVENGTRTDVTNDARFNLTLLDTNNNTLIDRVLWNVPMLSEQTFEVVTITILNVQSYPTVGGNWTVKFNTTGKADLMVTAVNGTTWSNQNEENDLKFLEIKSGDNALEYEWINNSLLIRNFSSDGTNFEVSKVLTSGRHTLEFKFGSDIKYAKNLASENANLTITTENITFVTATENASDVTETGASPNIKENSNLTINATIYNAGPDDITAGTDFFVLFYDGPDATSLLPERLIANVTVTTPDTGGDGYWNVSETVNATAYWDPALIGTHNISVHIDNATASSDPNLTDNNASKLINVSAFQKYWGNITGEVTLADSAGNSMITWDWSNATNTGWVYIVNSSASVNWSALHGLGCDNDNTLNTTGNDFNEADTALKMKSGDNNATGFLNNNITQLFSGGDANNATNTTYFIVHGTNITNVPIVNSTDMTNHTDVENANFITGILWNWDSGDDSPKKDYYNGNQSLIFIVNINHESGLADKPIHDYEIAIPCALNATIGGDVDLYVELK